MSTNQLAIFIAGWYVCSISLSLYNKWMFDPTKGLKIPYPILITSFHQLTLWILSFIYIRWRKYYYTNEKYIKHPKNYLKYILKFIIPTAIATAGDIGFSNVSFKFIPLTIYTVVKSSSIAFVLLFGCLFKLEVFHWNLVTIIMGMIFGVGLMFYSPSQNSSSQTTDTNSQSHIIIGVVLVLISSCLSGLRWVYTQLILRKGSMNLQYSSVPVDSRSEIDSHPVHTREISQHSLMDENAYLEHGHNEISESIKDNDKFSMSTITKNNNNNNTNSSSGVSSKSNSNTITITPLNAANEELPKKKHPIYTINELGPYMFSILLVTSLIIESPFPHIFHSNLFKNTIEEDHTFFSIFKGIILLILPGIQVFFMTLCEFGILQISKVLTLSIAGVAKEVLTIIFSMILLHEKIKGWQNWMGIFIILSDVVYYNYFRYVTDKKDDKYINSTIIPQENQGLDDREPELIVEEQNRYGINMSPNHSGRMSGNKIASKHNNSHLNSNNSPDSNRSTNWDIHLQTLSDNELFDNEVNSIGQRLET